LAQLAQKLDLTETEVIRKALRALALTQQRPATPIETGRAPDSYWSNAVRFRR
jgi:hypothetical protein